MLDALAQSHICIHRVLGEGHRDLVSAGAAGAPKAACLLCTVATGDSGTQISVWPCHQVGIEELVLGQELRWVEKWNSKAVLCKKDGQLFVARCSVFPRTLASGGLHWLGLKPP